MPWQYVMVNAWVPPVSPGVPTHPIVIPPPVQPPGGGVTPPVDPGYGYPEYPVDPGYGVPGPPYPDVKPPPWLIWGGGNEPFPTPPIANVPGVPGYRPPEVKPPGDWGIWGGGNEPFPTPPIANVPGIPGYRPPVIGGPPNWPPLPIVPPEEERPEHPDIPDLNIGNWLYVSDGMSYKMAFVPYPISIEHPIYDPKFPSEDYQPGTWVTVVYGKTVAWAWIPSTPSDSGNGGDEQKATA